MSWYRTGTVTVTNGSKTVTGVGTLWTTAVNVGDAFALVDANLNPTGAWYEVDVVVSNTELTLKQDYAGTTGGGKAYCVFNLVGNMTTPSFAQRLATFFASFQALIDKPTVTPTAASIPLGDANGKIDSGWVPDTSTTVKGVVKVGTNLSATDGVITVADASNTVKGVVELATDAEVIQGSDTERAVTPAGLLAGFPTRLRSNLLGTVSQTGGVPTGAVIESGSNANGKYVKFADGTMVCWATGLSVSGLTINVMANVNYTFPVAFSSAPSTSVGLLVGASVANVLTVKNGGGTLTYCNLNVISTSSSYLTISNLLDYHAIGRWY